MRALAVIFLFALFICEGIFAQDDSRFRSYFSGDDLKKLAKAEKLKSDAAQISADANKLNLEIINVQSEANANEKSVNKKVKDLENKSIQQQIAASGLLEKSHEIKFTVYKKYIDDFRRNHSEDNSGFIEAKLLEEQAGDNYIQAKSYRSEARKLEGYAKIEKLTEAALLEDQAMQQQLSVLEMYAGNSGSVNDNPPTAESTANIKVNQQMIDSYNRYMESGQFSDYTLSTGRIAAVTSFNSDQILKLWYDYIYGSQDDLMQLTVNDDSPSDSEEAREDQNESVETTTEEESAIVTENAGAVIYRVQIAANRSELSQRTLSRIYFGTKNVNVTKEDEWYKYSVGDFATFAEANEFKKTCGISNAFVVTIHKDSSAKPAPEKIIPETQTQNEITTVNGLPTGLIFRVQIGASRVPFRINQVSSIYSGNYPVEMISEDGWYKCQILGVRLYSDARRILSAIGNSGHIVAYEDGRKIDISDAVRKNKQMEDAVRQTGRKGQISETEFHVQLAASKNQIPLSELAEIYNGDEPVCVIFEDGWYKYHLKAGNSYKLALELKQNCNVTGSFIVAYLRAVKSNNYRNASEINE